MKLELFSTFQGPKSLCLKFVFPNLKMLSTSAQWQISGDIKISVISKISTTSVCSYGRAGLGQESAHVSMKQHTTFRAFGPCMPDYKGSLLPIKPCMKDGIKLVWLLKVSLSSFFFWCCSTGYIYISVKSVSFLYLLFVSLQPTIFGTITEETKKEENNRLVSHVFKLLYFCFHDACVNLFGAN